MDKRQLSALIRELEAERDYLDQTIQFLSSRFQSPNHRDLTALLASQPAGKKRGRPIKAATNPSTKAATKPSTKAATKRTKRNISDEARKKMSDAVKRRHAARRKQAANA